MTTEVELKLKIAADDVPLLLLQPILLEAGKPQLQNLSSCYFDTPTLDLLAQKAALRVRQVNQQWLQTFKMGGSAINGLHSRPEWEIPVPDEHPQPQLFEEPRLRALFTTELIKQLIPIFRTEFSRSIWTLSFQNSQIEVALDQGEVTCDNASEPICELELELKSGTEPALQNLANVLSQQINLVPDSISKAQRGYAMHQSHSFNLL